MIKKCGKFWIQVGDAGQWVWLKIHEKAKGITATEMQFTFDEEDLRDLQYIVGAALRRLEEAK